MRFEVHVAVTLMITVFWHKTPCTLINRHQCCSGTCCLTFRVRECSYTLKVDETGFLDMLLFMYQTTRSDSNLIVTQLVKKFFTFQETKDSLPCSQEPATGLKHKPKDSSSDPHTSFLKN